jgi:hypothetical protein
MTGQLLSIGVVALPITMPWSSKSHILVDLGSGAKRQMPTLEVPLCSQTGIRIVTVRRVLLGGVVNLKFFAYRLEQLFPFDFRSRLEN